MTEEEYQQEMAKLRAERERISRAQDAMFNQVPQIAFTVFAVLAAGVVLICLAVAVFG